MYRRGFGLSAGLMLASAMAGIGMAHVPPASKFMIRDELPLPSTSVRKRRKKEVSTGYISRLPKGKNAVERRGKKSNRLHLSRRTKNKHRRRAA